MNLLISLLVFLHFGLLITIIKIYGWFTSWRLSLIAGVVSVGILCWGSAEILSAVSMLTRESILSVWAFCCATLWLVSWQKRRYILREIQSIPKKIGNIRSRLGGNHWFWIPMIGIILALFIISIVSVPNNWDSMTYHLSRVVHWIQNRNLDFYPTHIPRQNHMSPGGEILILHSYLLVGSDRLVNLVQFSSFCIGLLGLSWISKELGGTSQTQLLTILTGITIPMGILQATSTQNDLVLSLWLICFIGFGLNSLRNGQTRSWVLAGASLGLAILTKSTAFLFAFPFCLWFGFEILRRQKPQAGKILAILAFVLILINFPHSFRNVKLYGNPLGPNRDGFSKDFVYTNQAYKPTLMAVNLAKNVSLHFGLPMTKANEYTISLVENISDTLNVDLNDPRISWGGYPFGISFALDEDHAGNLLHLLFFMTTITFYLCSKEIRTRDMNLFSAAILTGFIIFSVVLKWQPWHSRLHLPVFLLFAPWATMVISGRMSNRNLISIMMTILIIGSIPFVLSNIRRPLSGNLNVISTPRKEQYMVDIEIMENINLSLDTLVSSDCNQLGVITGWDDWEYPIWALAQHRNIDLRIEHVLVKDPSKKYSQPFVPCAILVTGQKEEHTIKFNDVDFSKVMDEKAFSLYLNENIVDR